MSEKNAITVRHPKFDFGNVRRYWAANNPLLTHFLNAVHVVIPAGERFFIQAVSNCADQIEDAEFAAEVRAFIGQEGWHSKIHTSFWQTLGAQGLPVKRFEAFYERVGIDWLQNRAGKKIAPAMKLSITAALEHYTAVMSTVFFDSDFPMDQFDDVMADLHRWHALEELEHKAVAFDLLQEIDPRYRTRVIGFVAATLLAAFFAVTGFFIFALGDKQLRKMPRKKVWGGLAIVRNRAVARSARHLRAYFRKDFHPNQITDPQAALDFIMDFEVRYAGA